MSRSLVIVSKSLAPYRVRFYREVAFNLRSTGWQVTLITATAGAKDHPWTKPGDTDDFLPILEVGGTLPDTAVWRAISKVKTLPRDFALPNQRLFEVLRSLRPDVVWTHEYSPFCVAASLWASFHDRVSLLSTDIGDAPPAYACSRPGLLFHRLVSFLYQGVIAQTLEATRRSHPYGVPVIFAPHAIDTSEYVPGSASPGRVFRFLFTGSLDDRKGIRRLIEAGRILAAEGKEFELHVLGSGPLSAWLAAQPDPWITSKGFVEGLALRNEYRDADAYVLPTNGDTYAVTVHEAAACGLPLIVGRNAGAVEALLDETSGRIVETEDPHEIAGHMAFLLENPPIAAKMGIAARIKAEAYDVRHVGAKAAAFILKFGTGTPAAPTHRNTLMFPAALEKAPTAPSVAVVFATMNRTSTAAECIRRLAAQTIRPGKLFVTDNASTDGTAEEIGTLANRLDLPLDILSPGSNTGNAGGIKLALEKAFHQGYQAAWILDDDSWPEPEALANLLAGEMPHETIRTSIVLVPGSDQVSWACEMLGSNGQWQDLNELGEVSGHEWLRVRRSWLGSLLPASVYADSGPLIGELFLRGEDEEYPRRLEAQGYRFMLSPSSVLRHPVGGPYVTLSLWDYRICLERNLRDDKLYYRIRNLIWIKAKETGKFSALMLAGGVIVLILRHFRPVLPSLKDFREALIDALSNRLGKRRPAGHGR